MISIIFYLIIQTNLPFRLWFEDNLYYYVWIVCVSKIEISNSSIFFKQFYWNLEIIISNYALISVERKNRNISRMRHMQGIMQFKIFEAIIFGHINWLIDLYAWNAAVALSFAYYEMCYELYNESLLRAIGVP